MRLCRNGQPELSLGLSAVIVIIAGRESTRLSSPLITGRVCLGRMQWTGGNTKNTKGKKGRRAVVQEEIARFDGCQVESLVLRLVPFVLNPWMS